MFARKKENKRGSADGSRGRMGVSELGFLDMDIDVGPDNLDDDDIDDDPSLEAELLAITTGKLPSRPVRRPRANNIDDLDRMIAESLRDSPSDEDEDDNLENDPTLLDELQQLTPTEEEPGNLMDSNVPEDPAPPLPARPAPPPPPTISYPDGEESMLSILQERLDMYKAAQANAKSAGETSKVRRLDRGIKTIESLIKSAKAGKHINEDDIPPKVATGGPKPPPTEEAPAEEPPPPSIIPSAPQEEELPAQEEPPPQENEPDLIDAPPETPADAEDDESRQVHALLCERRDQYKKAALNAKRQGDMTNAVQFVRTAKQFDAVIVALESGQAIDISGMPPAPPGFEDGDSNVSMMPSQLQTPQVTNEESQNSSAPEAGEDDPDVFRAPSAPTTTMEGLLQRLEKYQSTQKEAQAQGNSSKARRMGRIVKQYEDAIKLHKSGRPVPYDDLPDPPGFAPIPRDVVGGGANERPLPSRPAPAERPPPPPVTNDSGQPDRSIPPALPPRNIPKNDGSAPPLPARPPPSTDPGVRPTRSKKPISLHEKQLSAVIERQRLFREAALQAKQQGNIEAAKEYLRLSKGFTAMIEASKGGLPINLDSAPVPPQLMREDSFEVVEHEDCLPPGDRDEMYEKLEKDLQTQLEMCIRNRDYFSHLGDVSNAKKFHQLYEHSKKDLSCIKYAFKRGDPVPRFHYETRIFSIVQCCTDLTDNDLELTIVRGINYACQSPRDIDTYVKVEFPFPTETPFRDRTRTVKDTNNPEYNQCFVIPINRKSRALARVFKQRAIKLEIGVKGGFFRGDTVMGTVQVKLLPLEKRCTIHEAFDIMDGRKPQGGKLEVKVRIRDPLLSKQVEEIKEKWLVIDQYLAK